LKIAFASAGAITVTAGSPTPVAFFTIGDDADGDFRNSFSEHFSPFDCR
jgi:hypothetical protein